MPRAAGTGSSLRIKDATAASRPSSPASCSSSRHPTDSIANGSTSRACRQAARWPLSSGKRIRSCSPPSASTRESRIGRRTTCRRRSRRCTDAAPSDRWRRASSMCRHPCRPSSFTATAIRRSTPATANGSPPASRRRRRRRSMAPRPRCAATEPRAGGRTGKPCTPTRSSASSPSIGWCTARGTRGAAATRAAPSPIRQGRTPVAKCCASSWSGRTRRAIPRAKAAACRATRTN